MRMKNHAYCTNRYDKTQNRFEYLPVHSRETRCGSQDSGTAVTNFWAVLYIWWTIKDQCLARKHFAWCSIGKQLKPWYRVNQKNICKQMQKETYWTMMGLSDASLFQKEAESMYMYEHWNLEFTVCLLCTTVHISSLLICKYTIVNNLIIKITCLFLSTFQREDQN